MPTPLLSECDDCRGSPARARARSLLIASVATVSRLKCSTGCRSAPRAPRWSARIVLGRWQYEPPLLDVEHEIDTEHDDGLPGVAMFASGSCFIKPCANKVRLTPVAANQQNPRSSKFDSVERKISGKYIAAPEFTNWAANWLQNARWLRHLYGAGCLRQRAEWTDMTVISIRAVPPPIAAANDGRTIISVSLEEDLRRRLFLNQIAGAGCGMALGPVLGMA